MSNYQEYLAGTNPTNPASCLRIASFKLTGNNVVLTWTTVGGKAYTLQTNSAANGRFVDCSPVIVVPGTGESATNYVDLNARTNSPFRLYRVRLAQ
jgi:hypothetical protein